MRRRRRSAQEDHIESAYLANAADLLSYFGRRVQIPADAADLLSETFLVAWRRGDRMPAEPEQARMWLFGVARRVLANAARGAIRHSDLTHKLRAHLETLPTEHVDTETLDIRAALDAIPADQSELVRLVLWDGFTLPDAATILGISESTARGRYQRARTQLRELLREHEYEWRTP
ncbi:RNA polymerase sigma factor [Agromyces albus]|uniref:RNA polymerase sigma factor n=1 Tax=Agromyces albus TaxID=205332 RepID=A0A4Q2L2W1_9MICO|nr:RNA polymerase sigma factor [Agromyces albus]RXZ72458.1 RNA polymerase sigma factor [Agromyces albus]